MDFVPYRMLRNQPGRLSEKLAEEGQLVITKGGEPFAVMVNIEAGELGELLTLLARLRAQQTVSLMRAGARERGLNRLSTEEIDAEIREVRKGRKRS